MMSFHTTSAQRMCIEMEEYWIPDIKYNILWDTAMCQDILYHIHTQPGKTRVGSPTLLLKCPLAQVGTHPKGGQEDQLEYSVIDLETLHTLNLLIN